MTETVAGFFQSLGPGSNRRLSAPEFTGLQRQAAELEQRAARVPDLERRAERAEALQVIEPDLYAPGAGFSWFADIARVALKQGDDRQGGVLAARERLARNEEFEHRRTHRRMRQLQAEHDLERVLTRTPAEAAIYTRWAEAGGQLFDKYDELRDLEKRSGATRVSGAGGTFSPPGWLLDRFGHSPRAGAPLAAMMTQLPLPAGVQSINVPLFAAGGGAGTEVQAADAGPVIIRDPKDGTVSATIQTLIANLDASLQLMDQSPIPFDESFGQDIAEDMATQLDGQLLLGSGSMGQVNGLIPGGTLSAANSVLLTSTNAASSQTWAYGGASIAASAHQMTAQLYSKIATARGLPPESWLINPTVWAIICGSADGQNRPLVPPGITSKALHGLDVYEDENIPLSFGGTAAPGIGVSAGVVSPAAGNGTYTPLLLGRWSDLIYLASEPRVQVMTGILSGSLQVRYQVRRYVAALPARIQWGGGNVSYSGTSQSGGVNNAASVSYGAFYQPQANGPLNLSGAGY